MKYREKSGFIFSGISSAQSEYVNLAQKLIFPLRISLVKVKNSRLSVGVLTLLDKSLSESFIF